MPPDQRAVLEMVLRSGRGYDEIARLLSIDREAVRRRALSALEALLPTTTVSSHGRETITDYLLGQLSPRASASARRRLAKSPTERRWARAVAARLVHLARDPLPEIPAGQRRPRAAVVPALPESAPAQNGRAHTVARQRRAPALMVDGDGQRPPRRRGRVQSGYPVLPLTLPALATLEIVPRATMVEVYGQHEYRGRHSPRAQRRGRWMLLQATVLALLAATVFVAL